MRAVPIVYVPVVSTMTGEGCSIVYVPVVSTMTGEGLFHCLCTHGQYCDR